MKNKKIALFYMIVSICFLPIANATQDKAAEKGIDGYEKLLPMYSIAKERGHTQIDCAASSKVLLKTPSKNESSNDDLNFSCERNENNLIPICKITDVKQLELKASHKKVLETTLSRAFLFYFSKNRVEALSNAIKNPDGWWVTKPKNKRNIVQINSSMTELKMSEINVAGLLTTIDGFLFLKEITSSDKKGKANTAIEYIKYGDIYYPSSLHAKAVFNEKSDLDVSLKIANCTSK